MPGVSWRLNLPCQNRLLRFMDAIKTVCNVKENQMQSKLFNGMCLILPDTGAGFSVLAGTWFSLFLLTAGLFIISVEKALMSYSVNY